MPAGFEAWDGTFDRRKPPRNPRAVAGGAFAELLRRSQATPREFAEVLSRWMSRPVSEELVRSWVDPTGPKPPIDWFVAALCMVEETFPGSALPVLARLAG